MNKVTPIPIFKTEAEERTFWQEHQSTDYIDWEQSQRDPSLPNLEPSESDA